MPELTLNNLIEAFNEPGRGPLLSFKWAVRAFPDIDGVETIPNYYCETVNLPFSQVQEKTKVIAATNIFLAGLSQIQSFDMEMYEDEQARTLKYITGWHSLIQNPFTGGYYPALNYKKDIIVTLFDTRNEAILDVMLKNAWPLGTQNWALQYSSSERVKNNVNFACDAVIPLE